MNAAKIIHAIPSDPLTGAISVPGYQSIFILKAIAGKEVTARGVFSDILKLSNQLN